MPPMVPHCLHEEDGRRGQPAVRGLPQGCQGCCRRATRQARASDVRPHTHIYAPPGGCAPGAAHVWAMPEVRVTWGFITIKVSPTRGITVHPQGGPSPPRARATVQFQRGKGNDGLSSCDRFLAREKRWGSEKVRISWVGGRPRARLARRRAGVRQGAPRKSTSAPRPPRNSPRPTSPSGVLELVASRSVSCLLGLQR